MKKAHIALLMAGVCIGSVLATWYITKSLYEPSIDSEALSLTEFAHVEQIIDDYYLRDYDMEELQYAALKAMVAELNDPYSAYYTPEEYAELTQDLSGEYYGLGMEIVVDGETGLAKVRSTMKGSPAEAAGILAGDLIVSVDGQDVSGLSLQEISALCLGENGEAISIGVKRGGETLLFDLVRGEISREMLSYEMLDGNIGYIHIVQFGGNCEALFEKAMNHFRKNGAAGIVIDLRDNPGGYLDVVVAMLDTLLPEGTLVYTENKNGDRETYSSGADCVDIPLTLIVNGNTASAAEIFAGAVQDYGWGEVIGTTTYGKGVVQNIIEIESGAGIKITSSQYFTPKGRSIDGNGIYPDVYVGTRQAAVTDPGREEFLSDPQVARALEVLRQEIG
jgi:C-terminal peptidase (prc)